MSTPAGPADPEVKTVYAKASAGTATGSSGSAAFRSGVITTRSPPSEPANLAWLLSDTTSRRPASRAMISSHGRGNPGSSGTIAPPAHHTPSSAVSIPMPRSVHTPTLVSGPTPCSASARASRAAWSHTAGTGTVPLPSVTVAVDSRSDRRTSNMVSDGTG
jgi:hypothetical protein